MLERPPLEAWGVSGPVEPMAGGHRNRVVRTQEHNPPLVFKSTRRSEDAVAWLTPVMERAARSGFVVAAPKRCSTGAYVVQGWTCEPFIEGAGVSEKNLGAIRPMIETFHRLASDLPQRPGFLSSQDLMIATTGSDVDLTVMPDELVAMCRDAWGALDSKDQTVIHGDLGAGNLLRSADDRFALLDWDETRRDVPMFDLVGLMPPHPKTALARLAWEVACSWRIEPDYARRRAAELRQQMPLS